jgi:hypothetical protein
VLIGGGFTVASPIHGIRGRAECARGVVQEDRATRRGVTVRASALPVESGATCPTHRTTHPTTHVKGAMGGTDTKWSCVSHLRVPSIEWK